MCHRHLNENCPTPNKLRSKKDIIIQSYHDDDTLLFSCPAISSRKLGCLIYFSRKKWSVCAHVIGLESCCCFERKRDHEINDRKITQQAAGLTVTARTKRKMSAGSCWMHGAHPSVLFHHLPAWNSIRFS